MRVYEQMYSIIASSEMQSYSESYMTDCPPVIINPYSHKKFFISFYDPQHILMTDLQDSPWGKESQEASPTATERAEREQDGERELLRALRRGVQQ